MKIFIQFLVVLDQRKVAPLIFSLRPKSLFSLHLISPTCTAAHLTSTLLTYHMLSADAIIFTQFYLHPCELSKTRDFCPGLHEIHICHIRIHVVLHLNVKAVESERSNSTEQQCER